MAPDPGDGDATSPPSDGPTSVLTEPVAELATRHHAEDDPAHPGARYVVGATIGRGGMGEIVLAHDRQIGRDVAIKRARDRASQVRFLREARLQGRLDHPAIVPVHELAIDDTGRPFFVMKRVAGVTLRQVLRELAAGDAAAAARFPRQRLLRAFADVCLAVEFAHSRGVIHRDLKPDNIMLGEFGEVWLLDWGIARTFGDDEPAARDDGAPAAAATRTGALLGTPGYIAPEQLRGDPSVDHRADIFSLGCILYEILARVPLLPRDRDLAGFATFDARPSRVALDGDIPPELDALCDAATAVARDARPASARELGAEVQRYLDGDRDVSLRRRLAAEHLATAEAAFARDPDGTEARRIAMREAGRALALDPEATAAAALVGRLMLVPPAEVPAEVKRELAVMDDRTTRTQNRLALVGFMIYLAFVPVLAWLGATWPYLAALGALAVVSTVIAYASIKMSPRSSTALLAASLVVNMGMIAVLSRLCTPFLVAPGLAAATVLTYAIHPREGQYLGVVIAGMLGAALAPWLLEHLGVLSSTMRILEGGAIVLDSPALTPDLFRAQAALVLFAVALSVIVGLTARAVAHAQIAARQAQLVQAWHLRQIVAPSPRAQPRRT
jgi:eukaryotic-like serine/threonine-protein kinase